MAKFGKRHYEAIALAVQDTLKFATDTEEEKVGVRELAGGLAEMFARDNPQFKPDRFLRACVPGANVKARS